MSAFFKDGVQLLDVYGLNTQDPQGSWDQNSTAIDLSSESKEKSADLKIDNAYDILNEILEIEKKLDKRSIGNNSVDSTNSSAPAFIDVDPLDGKSLLNRLKDVKDPSIFSINSTQFNSKMFLQIVHSADTFDQLTKDLDTLDYDLQQQSGELKELVQSNFFRYVRSKNNLDNIYEQLNNTADFTKTFSKSQNDDTRFQNLENSVLETSKDGVLLFKKLLLSNDSLKHYSNAISFIEKNSSLINLPNVLKKHLNNGDYTELLFQYNSAKKTLKSTKPGPIEQKVWIEAENVIDQYRQHLWNQLLENEGSSIQSKFEFLPIISKLVDLNVEDSPIVLWIQSRLDQLSRKLLETKDFMEEKFQEYKLNLKLHYTSISSSGCPEGLSCYLQFTQQPEFSKTAFVDNQMVVQMWLFLVKYINDLCKIGGDFVEFWEHVHNFLNGTYQQSILNDKKRENILSGNTDTEDKLNFILNLEEYQVTDINNGGTDFINELVEIFQTIFDADPQDPKEYNVLPPNCNNLSCLRYLPKLIHPIFRLSTEIDQLNINRSVNKILKETCSIILNNSIKAINYTRLEDYKQLYLLETWSIHEYKDDLTIGKCTLLPIIVKNINIIVIKTLRDLIFYQDALPTTDKHLNLDNQSKALIKNLESQQINALETVLESLLKYATKNKENPRTLETLLTLNNIQILAKDAFPFILQYFKQEFEIEEESTNISNLQMFVILDKMYTSILSNYASDLKFELRKTLEKEFTYIDWFSYTASIFKASDYILEVLMILVKVHKDCNNISPDMSFKVTSEAQQFISTYLYELFKTHVDRISTDGLLQLTLDFQFFMKVLSNILDAESERKLNNCLLICFQNNSEKLQECIQQIDGVITSNLNKTAIQFASFRD